MAVPPTRSLPAASQHTPFALPVTGAGCGGDGEGNPPSPPEWALVELQGELEPPAGTASGAEYEAGTLAMSKTKPGGVELTVGIHLLEGSVVPLKKPFAVLEKRGGRASGSGGGEEGAPQPPCPSTTRYEVVGVIRKKCIFKDRPRAIIAGGPGEAARREREAAAAMEG